MNTTFSPKLGRFTTTLPSFPSMRPFIICNISKPRVSAYPLSLSQNLKFHFQLFSLLSPTPKTFFTSSSSSFSLFITQNLLLFLPIVFFSFSPKTYFSCQTSLALLFTPKPISPLPILSFSPHPKFSSPPAPSPALEFIYKLRWERGLQEII